MTRPSSIEAPAYDFESLIDIYYWGPVRSSNADSEVMRPFLLRGAGGAVYAYPKSLSDVRALLNRRTSDPYVIPVFGRTSYLMIDHSDRQVFCYEATPEAVLPEIERRLNVEFHFNAMARSNMRHYDEWDAGIESSYELMIEGIR